MSVPERSNETYEKWGASSRVSEQDLPVGAVRTQAPTCGIFGFYYILKLHFFRVHIFKSYGKNIEFFRKLKDRSLFSGHNLAKTQWNLFFQR